jgi:2-polyprenyl-3-methyl-5-hydroxy-6-metoxy-1,4-benzoquinol methylase
MEMSSESHQACLDGRVEIEMSKINSKMDPMGRAIADYFRTKKADRLRVFSPMFEEDEIPLTTLFRTYENMPKIEQKALDMATGKTLDVGAGAGCHSLVLQEKGIDVTAIDISPLSVATMKKRGVKKAFEQDFFALGSQQHVFALEGQYDTILMLMNGIGIVGTLDRLPEFFRLLDKILAPGGQVLCDSSDISYVFETEDGLIELPDDMAYYGEQSFQMQYKDTIGEPFPWLYIDADTLRERAARSGYAVEVVAEGEHYDYLARITKKNREHYEKF